MGTMHPSWKKPSSLGFHDANRPILILPRWTGGGKWNVWGANAEAFTLRAVQTPPPSAGSLIADSLPELARGSLLALYSLPQVTSPRPAASVTTSIHRPADRSLQTPSRLRVLSPVFNSPTWKPLSPPSLSLSFFFFFWHLKSNFIFV